MWLFNLENVLCFITAFCLQSYIHKTKYNVENKIVFILKITPVNYKVKLALKTE